jgi:hypothetical protein
MNDGGFVLDAVLSHALVSQSASVTCCPLARIVGGKVFGYLKHEADAGMPVHNVAKAQECTAEACNISIGNVQRIISDGNVAICILLSLCTSRIHSCRSVQN